jgi:hypothetical protein
MLGIILGIDEDQRDIKMLGKQKILDRIELEKREFFIFQDGLNLRTNPKVLR